mgnify:CR=1 FL=1|jgi:hypothetical protein
MGEINVEEIVLDDTNGLEVKEVEVQKPVKEVKEKVKKPVKDSDAPINCLRNSKVTVHFVPKLGKIDNPKHILYGGMAESAVRYYTVPLLKSGAFTNVLTNAEKAYLEEVMGLEYNALSVHKKVDNFWSNYFVRVTKQDTYLDLSIPEDYIKYKVLLANNEYIAPSLQSLEDYPKETYQFVLIEEGEETKNVKKEMSATMQSYMEFGKVQDDIHTLRTIIEALDGRPTAKNTKIEFLQERVHKLIQADAKTFIRVITDPLLPTKVLIKRCIEEKLISNRGGMLYLQSDKTPLCDDNEEPTLNIAAKFLSSPKRQSLKFSLEAKLKEE